MKRLKNIISVVLINLFLCVNIGFANVDVQQYSTLSPHIEFGAELFQNNFSKGIEAVNKNSGSAGLADIVVESLPFTEYEQALASLKVEKGFFSDIGKGHGEKTREGYQKAMAFLKTKIANDQSLKEQDILAMHERLSRTTIEITPELALYISNGGMVAELGNANVPGNYRHSNLLGVARFESPRVENIPLLMNELLEWVAEQEKQIMQNNPENVVLALTDLAAQVHYLIGIIHPFVDSNGRMGRLLTNYLLAKYGFEIAGEDRDAYDKTLSDDFVYNFGELSRMNRVDLNDADWGALLNLSAPHFRGFLLNSIRKVNPSMQTINDPVDYSTTSVIVQFELINMENEFEQSI